MPPETTDEELPSTEEWLASLPNDQLVNVLIEAHMERSNSSLELRALTRDAVLRRMR